ncbi:hypothetical protein VE04_03927 [Pseudogymnoascus sp. 24MN13]|nr:hypothetical protein VE04_03927 [Pseudogymnoascus sp. 24MN13]
MASAAILQYPVTLPTTQTAVIASETGDFEISSNVPLPSLQPDEILIKTAADAFLVSTVQELWLPLDQAMCTRLVAYLLGDRVCGSASGMNKLKPLGGAFAEHVVLPGSLTLKIPDSLPMEDAAALGTAVASAAMALFWSLGIDPALFGTGGDNKTGDEAPKALVYGGSTCTGTMVIQLLRLCGFHVLTTCSPRNFKLAKSFGAHETFDYKSSGCAADIRAHCDNALEYAVDCVAEDSTMKFCYAAIGRAGGKYTALNPFNDTLATRKVIQPDWILATRPRATPRPSRARARGRARAASA